MQTITIITIVFWILLVAFVIPNYIQGIQKLILQKEKVETFRGWNFSLRFMQFLGIVEVIGGTLLIFPATRMFAIPVYAILLTGAVYTHRKNNDTAKNTMVPVIVGIHLAVLLLVNAWMMHF
jgi:putative oxidoreductase